MNNENKHDLSISMLRANIVGFLIGYPIAMLQLALFYGLHDLGKIAPIGNYLLLVAFVMAGIFVHELIHGLTWMFFGQKPFSSISFGFQWKTLTPFAHLKEPIEINIYRLGGFMPGLILGLIPYSLSLILGNSNLLWFGLIHTVAASGDWLILWLIRNVNRGTLVEDHPSRAGCYALET